MPLSGINRIINFGKAHSSPDIEVMLSGGEPLLHRQFREVIQILRQVGITRITITTNGSMLSDEHLSVLAGSGFDRVTISISIDSICAEKHDAFRGMDGAFGLADNALKMVGRWKHLGVRNSMRVSVRPNQIGELVGFVQYAAHLRCDAVSFSAILPCGRAQACRDLCMTADETRVFLSEVRRLSRIYSDLVVTSNDPLYPQTNAAAGLPSRRSSKIAEYSGCVAGIFHFSVDPRGKVTPCPMTDVEIMNAFDPSTDLAATYVQSPVVKRLVSRNIDGECDTCSLKSDCGGCRARALLFSSNLYAVDPYCWRFSQPNKTSEVALDSAH